MTSNYLNFLVMVLIFLSIFLAIYCLRPNNFNVHIITHSTDSQIFFLYAVSFLLKKLSTIVYKCAKVSVKQKQNSQISVNALIFLVYYPD